MPKQVSDKIIDDVLQKVQLFPHGASVHDILQALVISVPKRTLQRYLSLLTAKNRLIALGNARARRYLLALKQYIPAVKDIPIYYAREEEENHFGKIAVGHQIPLSQEALSIQAHVRQSIQARRPVGYNREFLNGYRPNETYYLPENTRKHLFEIGNSPDHERPAGTYARHMLNRLLIDLSWNSSRLEGNTYSLLETERLLELGEGTPGKDSTEAQMILNHKAAIEFMVESASEMKFDSFTIFNLHALLADNLLKDEKTCGRLRVSPVGIRKSVYHPLALPQLIEEYFQQILDTAEAITDPFEQSFFVMVQLPYLQPFIDVNKRVSRLAANIPLIRENLCPLSFVDVPEQAYISGLLGVYELNRIELLREVYVWAYERSSARYSATRQELGDPDPLRLRFRNLIISLIGDIVRQRMDKQTAVSKIRQNAAEAISLEDQARFIEVIEIELMSLHIGNIARFRLKPAEYNEWQKGWR